MAVDQSIGIFAGTLRDEFMLAYEAAMEQPPWERIITDIPSDARIEHYPWFAPPPGISLYSGHRRYGRSDTIKYSVENREFSDGFIVNLIDWDDDQVGGYKMQPKIMADRASAWPGRWCMKHLVAGTTRTCYDGSVFFANNDSSRLGTVNNLLTHTAVGSSDSVTSYVIALYTGGRVKPLLWQNRQAPKLDDNSGTKEMSESKELRFWLDMRGNAAYGWPFDAVKLTITNTPNVTDMHAVFTKIQNAFRGFQLPKSLTDDEIEYPHEQVKFSTSNLMLVVSPVLENVTRNALNETLVAQQIGSNTVAVNNVLQGWADFMVTNYLA
jgi:phage major head subunit gpT-like protein